jgi:transcriptional regulator with XRE-family HTH domain
MTSLANLRRKLLTDPDVRAEYDRLGSIFAVVGEMVEARQAAGLTQGDVAARMGTSQSAVARLESARHMPTFDMLTRYAAAIGRHVELRLVPGASSAVAHAAGRYRQENRTANRLPGR